MPKLPKNLPEFVLLSCDPGTASFSYTVLKAKVENRRLSVEFYQHGFIYLTVKDMKQAALKQQATEFADVFRRLRNITKYQGIWAERYMARNVSRQTAIEAVNLMLGIMVATNQDKMVRYIPASEWKNQFRRSGYDLDDLYLCGKGLRIPTHTIDSTLIGIYGLHRMLKLKGFEFFDSIVGASSRRKNSDKNNLFLEKLSQVEIVDFGDKKSRMKPKRKRVSARRRKEV